MNVEHKLQQVNKVTCKVLRELTKVKKVTCLIVQKLEKDTNHYKRYFHQVRMWVSKVEK